MLERGRHSTGRPPADQQRVAGFLRSHLYAGGTDRKSDRGVQHEIVRQRSADEIVVELAGEVELRGSKLPAADDFSSVRWMAC